MKPQLSVLLASLLFIGCSLKTIDRDKEKETSEKSSAVSSSESEVKPKASNVVGETELAKICAHWMSQLPDNFPSTEIVKICQSVEQLPGCTSHESVPIFHLDRRAKREKPERILTFALIHGDEYPSGSVARAWMQRLLEIDPRNEWRVVPILNPDGMKRKTRMNARGVDLNRNFPSEDWDELAQKYWVSKTNSDQRRQPGPAGGSEVETQCAMKHIDDFKPDLIISIHTPYGVLDFDGPKLKFPPFKGLPWVSLGTFPGSLGRYMWTDRKKPVLTIELKQDLETALDRFDRLQDISGQVALQIKTLQEIQK